MSTERVLLRIKIPEKNPKLSQIQKPQIPKPKKIEMVFETHNDFSVFFIGFGWRSGLVWIEPRLDSFFVVVGV